MKPFIEIEKTPFATDRQALLDHELKIVSRCVLVDNPTGEVD